MVNYCIVHSQHVFPEGCIWLRDYPFSQHSDSIFFCYEALLYFALWSILDFFYSITYNALNMAEIQDDIDFQQIQNQTVLWF